MNEQSVPVLIIVLIICIILPGCIDKDLGSLSDNGPDSPVLKKNHVEEVPPAGAETKEPVSGEKTPSEYPAVDNLKSFIQKTFPLLTSAYMDIRGSDRALDAAGVQEKALALETLVKDITNEYGLDRTLPEKSIFPGLTTQEKVVLNNYIGYIKDLEYYGSNLKQAIYWKNSGSDTTSLGNYRRTQDLADNYKKKVVTDIKKLDEYCKEWDISCLDEKLIKEYTFIS